MATVRGGGTSEIHEGQVGATVDIHLEAATGTGFRWELVPSGESIVALEATRWCGVDPERPGGPALQQFRFRILEAGSADLMFRYARPWEPSPMREQHVRIVARPAEPPES